MPNKFTFSFVIKGASQVLDYEIGRVVHGMAVKTALNEDMFVVNSLIYFYATCGHLDLAYHVFVRSFKRDVISWNSMISGFSKGDCPEEVLDLFHAMQAQWVVPNVVTMVGVFFACIKKVGFGIGEVATLVCGKEWYS
ncbi:hypothetical protein POM88_002958 [Heracleum sosnowskyi]|uniref:Pentatricopeptide repeat-containing protein n=1 Tax=Heracleum sosnowskyi TaxID=360622 RepID=A0AAD8ND22_9APIA|nr:hypothetical protein POM88_002958 [Heracleum sosnowskyi]